MLFRSLEQSRWPGRSVACGGGEELQVERDEQVARAASMVEMDTGGVGSMVRPMMEEMRCFYVLGW